MQGQQQKLVIGAVIFVVLLGVLAFMVYQQMQALNEEKSAIKKLENRKGMAEKQIQRKDELVRQTEATLSVFDELVEFLPSEDQFTTRTRILSLVSEFAARTNVDFRGIVIPEEGEEEGKKNPIKVQEPESFENFQTVSVTIRLYASFFELMHFLNAIESHESFLRVDQFKAEPRQLSKEELESRNPEDRQNPLYVELRITTYSYRG